MNAQEIRDLFQPWRIRHARPAWKPVVLDGDVDRPSRFGGSPTLSPGEAWPACASCGDPMQFFLELDLARCPGGPGAGGEGLMQLFYCSRDDGACETWRPFSGTHLVRISKVPGSRRTHPKGMQPFPPRAVDRWKELEDYPHPSEHEPLGLDYVYDFSAKRVSVRCEELALGLADVAIDLDVAETISMAEAGDKLRGWPHWIQGVEYPQCPRCTSPMGLLLQVDSEDHVPHMFGDSGCGHVTQCPVHPDVLAFGWACC